MSNSWGFKTVPQGANRLPKTRIGLDQVVIDDSECAKVAVGRIVVIRKREMKARFKPPRWFTDM